RGPIDDPGTGLQYLDVDLRPGWAFRHALDEELTAFVNVFEGEAQVAGQPLPLHHLGVLGGGDGVEVEAGADGTRFILVAGRPLREPIVQHGPFVMNTREEIEQALTDYRDGTLVRRRAAVTEA
ncbi:MAG: pirin-like C-terminal cupin domain-containing protein, partial [Chromatiales bacterium]